MKVSTWMIGISAATLAFSAQAQNAPTPPADAPTSQPAPPSGPPSLGGPPPVNGPAAPQTDLPDGAAPPARPMPPAPPSDIRQSPAMPAIGAQSPEVEAAPPPPESYPKCSSTVRDECRNPGGK